MSAFNSRHNRVVWFDLPVVDLERASRFYEAVLGLPVQREQVGDLGFSVLAHDQGNGGCLVPGVPAREAHSGPLLYFNAEGRIRAAVAARTASARLRSTARGTASRCTPRSIADRRSCRSKALGCRPATRPVTRFRTPASGA